MADRRIDQLTQSESVDDNDLFVIWKSNILQTRSLRMENIIPVGALMPFYGSVAPDGWFICDGTDTTNTSNQLDLYHPKLYEVLGNSNILPDLRECVLVGAGQSTRAILDETGHSHDVYSVGEFKDDQLQNITASFAPAVPNLIESASGAFVPVNKGDRSTPRESSGSYNLYKSFDLDASRVARTGTNTHGKQLGVNYIIKC